jgi:hypothetical protein
MGYGLNLGNYANQLGLNDFEQEQAQAQANVAGTMGAGAGPTDQQVSQTAQTAAPKVADSGNNALGTTQQYMKLADTLGQDDEKNQNGLSKVLGIVGMFA